MTLGKELRCVYRGAHRLSVAELPYLNHVDDFFQLPEKCDLQQRVVEASAHEAISSRVYEASLKKTYLLRVELAQTSTSTKRRRVAEIQAKLPASPDFAAIFRNFFLVLHHNGSRLKMVWDHPYQPSIAAQTRPARELPQPGQKEEVYKEIKLVLDPGKEQAFAAQRSAPRPGKVLRLNSPHEERLPKDMAVLYAQQAVIREKKELEAGLEAAIAERVKADYVEESYVKQIGKLQWRAEQRQKDVKKYKRNMAMAQHLAMRNAELEAQRKREAVRRRKELARLRLTSFPFRPAGRLLLSSGPTPFRRLAAARSKPARGRMACAYDTDGRRKAQADGFDLGSPATPLHEAFMVLRQLTATNDPFYLDFNKLLLTKVAKRRNLPITRKAFFGRILKGVKLSHRERRMLWRHFAQKDFSNEISVEDVKVGFYNQRGLLSKYKRQVEAESLRETILKHSSAVTTEAEDEAIRASSTGLEMTKITVDIQRLKGVQCAAESIFCIGAIAKVVGNQCIMVLNEVRCTVGSNYRMTFELPSANLDGDERILIEFRAKHAAAASDANSVFLGEIFEELEEIKQQSGEWAPLAHGVKNACAQVSMTIERFSGAHDADGRQSPLAEFDEVHDQAQSSEDEEGYRCTQEAARQGIKELLKEQGFGDFPEVRTDVSREIGTLLSKHYSFG